METKKRDNLKIMLEQAEARLVKENQKTVLFMTIYFIILSVFMMYEQNSNIKDIIVEAVILGAVISLITIVVYIFYTSMFTNKKSLEQTIVKLKIELDIIDRMKLSDDFTDEENK